MSAAMTNPSGASPGIQSTLKCFFEIDGELQLTEPAER
jgi:hypothetical protein